MVSLFIFVLINFKIYTSFNALPESWDTLAVHDIFLQSNYLKAIEKATPINISWFYIAIFNTNGLVGIAVIQRIQLYLKDMFRTSASSVFKEFIRNNLSKILKGNILVVGNMTHTGQHGVFIDTNKIDQREFLDALFKAINEIRIQIKRLQKKNIRVILCKDYFKTDSIHHEKEFFESQNLHKLTVQPNMIMPIRENWLKARDYNADLNKKYRSRYKRAKKKFGEIHIHEMGLETIEKDSIKLYKLYENVSDNARFNTFVLPQNHFYCLKKYLKDNFRVFGYYLDNELVGFYTLILNNKALETYFLGYDKEHQYPNQLYLNMLYDMAHFAIENRFTTVVYARTAMEIKSSVGALPVEMVMYMKHTNKFANAILKLVFRFMNPSQKWRERNPFKS